MTKLVVANWKSNPDTVAEAKKLAGAIEKESRAVAKNVDVVICPPFIFLESISGIKKSKLGAQDAFWSSGPYTGEISVAQLKKIGVEYIIVGHSERRRNFNESDEIVNHKLKTIISAGIKVILCVGEWPEYRNDIEGAKRFVKDQLDKDLEAVDLKLVSENLFIAYEPVWAIGTGLNDSPEHAAEMAKFIRNVVSAYSINPMELKILYGGSITSNNANQFLSLPEISGLLVGGASLDAEEFKKIIRLAANTH